MNLILIWKMGTITAYYFWELSYRNAFHPNTSKECLFQGIQLLFIISTVNVEYIDILSLNISEILTWDNQIQYKFCICRSYYVGVRYKASGNISTALNIESSCLQVKGHYNLTLTGNFYCQNNSMIKNYLFVFVHNYSWLEVLSSIFICDQNVRRHWANWMKIILFEFTGDLELRRLLIHLKIFTCIKLMRRQAPSC